MEQVTLPEGEERRLLEALLTAKGAPRKTVTVAAAARFISGSALSLNTSDLEAALVRLVGRGLLESHSKGKQRAYQVTAAVARALKPPAPPRRTRPRAATVEDLQALEVRLNQKLDQIEQLLAPRAQSKPGANGKQVEAAIPPAIRQADQQGRHGGLVPIPEVRRLVLQQTGATRAQFDQALLAMERDFRVDLKIADDARRADAPEGIQVPGRGLVYYALSK
jgi:hypothetical protein